VERCGGLTARRIVVERSSGTIHPVSLRAACVTRERCTWKVARGSRHPVGRNRHPDWILGGSGRRWV